MKRKAQRICRDEDLHTKRPQGYTAFFEWAEKMGKTHVQTKCKFCGLYAIWKPKDEVEND